MTEQHRRILMVSIIAFSLVAEGAWSLWPSWHPDSAMATAFAGDVQAGQNLRRDIQNAYRSQENSGNVVSLDSATDITPVVTERIPAAMLVEEARHILEYAGFRVQATTEGAIEATVHLSSPTYLLQPEIWVHVSMVPSVQDGGLTVARVTAWIQRPS